MRQRLQQSEAGYVMVTAVLALAVMAILGSVAVHQASTALRISAQAVQSEQALYAANAGVEWVLAEAMRGQTVPLQQTLTGSVSLAGGLTGTYSLWVTSDGSTLTVTADGRVRDAQRQIRASIPLGQGGDGSGGGGNGGSGSEGVINDLAFGHGPLTFKNNANVCGDLYAQGDVELSNNMIIWNRTRQQDPNSPCDSILGTGRVVSTGRLTRGSNTVIQGGWCDSANKGPGYACDEPQVNTLPDPNFAALKTDPRTTRWFVRSSNAAFCTGRTNCQTLSGGLLTLFGNRTYSNEIIWVDGNFELPHQGEQELVITGTVTFAVTGDVYLGGNVRCAPTPNSCGVAFIAGGSMEIRNSKSVRAILQAVGPLTIQNQVTIYGNLITASMNVDNGLMLYPVTFVTRPPAVPGAPGDSPTPPPPAATAEGYSSWQQ